jgi:hypothetical protein
MMLLLENPVLRRNFDRTRFFCPYRPPFTPKEVGGQSLGEENVFTKAWGLQRDQSHDAG